MDTKQVKKQTPEEIDELMKPRWRSRFPVKQYSEHYIDAADPTLQAYADSDAPVENVASDPPVQSERLKWTPNSPKRQTPEEIDELMRLRPEVQRKSSVLRHPLQKVIPPNYPDDYLDAVDPSIQAYADTDAFRRLVLRRRALVENAASDPPIETSTPQASNESSSVEKTNPDRKATKRSR
jgi:hypothetical protein